MAMISNILTGPQPCEIIGCKTLDILFLTGGNPMAEKKAADVVLRPKRQVTLPREICDQLSIRPGDVLEVTVEDSTLIARPRKTVALEALKEIQQAFKRSGITEEELQEMGRRTRQEVAKERYGAKA
jgi:AbrB family looped-hinge helix DNA binding protein